MTTQTQEKVKQIIYDFAATCEDDGYVKYSIANMLEDGLTEEELSELPTFEENGKKSICIYTLLNQK